MRLFLEPGHFHAALTLRVPHPRVSEELVVDARDGQELRDFLALVERFNRRPAAATRWRPAVITVDVDDRCWPGTLADRALAKYTLLAEAAAVAGRPA